MSRDAKRTTFRVLGPVILVVAVVLLVQFVMSMDSDPFGQDGPKMGWGFAGIALIFVGLVCCQAGYGGAAGRYAAEEMGPAARTMGENLGLRREPGGPHCTACGTRAEAGDAFCSSCGQPLRTGG